MPHPVIDFLRIGDVTKMTISAIISAVLAVSAAVKYEMLFPIFVAIMTDFILIAAAKLTHQEMKYI